MSESLAVMSCTRLKGVGPRVAERLAKLNIHSVQDLLFHLPYKYQDRTTIRSIRSLRPGEYVVIEGRVIQTQIKFGKRRSLLCTFQDKTGLLNLRFFYFNQSQKKTFDSADCIRCFGEVRFGPAGFEMVHPEYQVVGEGTNEQVENHLTPIYPTTQGLQQTALRKLIDAALINLTQANQIQDLVPTELLEKYRLPSLFDALHYAHKPPPDAPQQQLLDGQHPAQQRLAFEELLAHQLSLRLVRAKAKRFSAANMTVNKSSHDQFIKLLNFNLTQAQQRVIAEIHQDIAQQKPMLRLLQGDVGSGKTVVAAITAITAISSGYQVAIMAPTEILAKQHVAQFTQWFAPLNICVTELISAMPAAEKKLSLAMIASQKAQCVIGTHALFQQDVKFKKLGFVIVDEQHRFGVQQRLSLLQKGTSDGQVPHQLIMTATPIPRTLAMTAYADLDCSIIDELPPGRTPVKTIAISQQRRAEIIDRVRQHCLQQRQVYWVCTLIEESESLAAQAAQKTWQQLTQALPELTIGLIHGRMSAKEKQPVMQAYISGDIQVLVATTVIEVGVNVSNASLMVIENAERLGLSQLHQLRGRVGRGNTESFCVLLFQSPLSGLARERLDLMRRCHDGFEIAEKDLQLRGPGEVLGTRQTGLQDLRIADLQRDQALIPAVQQVAKELQIHHPDRVQPLIDRWLGNADQFGFV